MNAFQFDTDYVIGAGITKFNHACRPNAYLTTVDHVNDTKFYGVFTVTKVAAGEEITLDYFNGHNEVHDMMTKKHGISCSCTQESLKNALARAKIELNLATAFRDQYTNLINFHVDQHFNEHGKRIDMFRKKIRAFAKNKIRVQKGT
jgi:hypothetical protein